MKKVIITLLITFLLDGCVTNNIKDYSFQPIITSGETGKVTLKRIAIHILLNLISYQIKLILNFSSTLKRYFWSL